METKFDYDIVIVGAGPAGSSASYTAAKNGAKVALIEKEDTVAQTVRTSGVTWIEDIKSFGIPKDCYNPIRKFTFCSPKNEITISDSMPKAAVLDVRKTYRFLSDLAVKEGAELFVKTNVTDVITDENGTIVGVKALSPKKELRFTAKVVIDASGFQSIVARTMGLVGQWKKFGVGAEYEAFVENVDSETWWLMVGQQYSPSGYAWIFPVGKNKVRIGVGIGKPNSDVDPKVRLGEIIDKKLGPVKILGKISPLEYHYGLIPNEGLCRKTVYDNLILVGDSAGQANPLVLEGIRYAIKFGRVAGDIASNAVKSHNTSKKALSTYEQIWKKEIQTKINSALKVQKRWLSLSDEEWDREIEIIKELDATEFINFIKADFSLPNILRLATHHPKLAVRQLFNMVKGIN